MKCISCQLEINPQWKHAVDINVCPFCGKHIMEEHLKNLLSSLSKTMDGLLEYQDQLDDWMLSNHNYIKTNSPIIQEYMPKNMVKINNAELEELVEKKNKTTYTTTVKNDQGEDEDVQVEKIQSEEKTNDFFKRAEVVRKNSDLTTLTDKASHLKNTVQQIKKAGLVGLTSESGTNTLITPEMLEVADPESVAELESLLSDNEHVASALTDSGDDEIPASVLAMASRSKSGSSNKDLLKLQQMRERTQNASANFASGANRGKNGFSRS